MAIEIKELHVTVNIGKNQSTGGTESKQESNGECNTPANQETVVDEAVKEVLRIMKEQKER